MKVPSKFYQLLGAGGDGGVGIPDPLTTTQLTNPNIYGFRWRQAHYATQTALATYDWSAIDAALDACEASGKLLGLSVGWGTRAAEWVYDTVEEFVLDPANETGHIPQIFDPVYLPLLLAFIEEFGSLYDGHPNVSYTVVSGCMQHYEGYLAKSADEETRFNQHAIDAGFDDLRDGWWTISQQIISAYAEAFPNTAVMFTSARPFPSDAGQVQQSLLKEWIHSTFPGHCGWMTAQLKARSGGPFPPGTLVNNPHGFQAINNSASDLERFYVPGGLPDPPPAPPQPIIDFINNGLGSQQRAQYLEIYTGDMLLAENQAVYAERAAEFTSFTDYVPPGDESVPTGSVPQTSIPGVSVPPGEIPPVVTARTVVPRIIQCKTGTHARNIILAHKRLGPPVIVPVPPGPVEIIDVTTPGEPSSGTAVGTFLSPVGADITKLNYRVYVTGGPGSAEVTARIPV